jgi:alpha-1,6-rhamnosyltransferase
LGESVKITIIVPTYRRHRFLRRALASAAAQDYPIDAYEVVVVNDGGSGTNRKNLRKMWKGACELRYARIRHAGQSAANNRGLELARGEYVTFLHDDDFIYPNKMRVLAGFLDENTEANVVYSLPQYVNQSGRRIDTPSQLRRFIKRYPRLTWAQVKAGSKMWIHGTSTMYRTSILRDAGGWDVNLPTAEEWELHLRLLKLGHDFFGIPTVTTAYRIHPGNKSAGYRKNRAKPRSYINNKLAKIQP